MTSCGGTPSGYPARGEIGIFNRSQYEEVLVVRVHPEILDRQHLPAAATGKDVWARRYREINDWERYLSDNGFKVIKCFLNLSKEEQRIRFLKRVDLPDKNWKFSAADYARHGYSVRTSPVALISACSGGLPPEAVRGRLRKRACRCRTGRRILVAQSSHACRIRRPDRIELRTAAEGSWGTAVLMGGAACLAPADGRRVRYLGLPSVAAGL